jgi:hypothetical protein
MANERAAALWGLLVGIAAERRTITYGEAAKRVGGIARGLGASLRPIQAHCKASGLPNLSVLVVQAASGRQGDGFDGDPDRVMVDVFAQNWSSMKNPFSGGSKT